MAIGTIERGRFQTLTNGLRTFLLLCQYQKRSPLTAVQHSQVLLPPFVTTRASAGTSRRKKAGRLEHSPLLDFPRLKEILQQWYHTLKRMRQRGQPLRCIVWKWLLCRG